MESLARQINSPEVAYRSYRMLLGMFGEQVLACPRAAFEQSLEAVKAARGVLLESELTADELKDLCNRRGGRCRVCTLVGRRGLRTRARLKAIERWAGGPSAPRDGTLRFDEGTGPMERG